MAGALKNPTRNHIAPAAEFKTKSRLPSCGGKPALIQKLVKTRALDKAGPDQKFNFSANWIWRMAAEVEVILPKVDAAVGLEPLFQANWPPKFNNT